MGSKLTAVLMQNTVQTVRDGLVNSIDNLYLWKGSFVAVEDDRRFNHRLFVSDASSKMSRPYGSRTFMPQTLKGEKKRCLPGHTLLFMEPASWGLWLSHFYHFHEHVLAVWDIVGSSVDRIVFVGDGYDPSGSTWKGPNKVNARMVKALWPKAKIVAWDKLRKSSEDKLLRFEKVTSVDRGVTLSDEACRAVNKMLGRRIDTISQDATANLAKRVLRSSGLKLREHGSEVVYVRRTSGRCLKKEIEEELLSSIDVPLSVVDFAEMTFDEQLKASSRAKVLVGVHGNGLTHALFAPKNATLIEIFPRDSLMQDYTFVARARGLEYVAFDESGKISQRRLKGHRGHDVINHSVNDLDVKAVVREIKKAMNV